MVDDLDWLRVRPLDHFSLPCRADPSQPPLALRAGQQPMLDALGGHCPHPSSILPPVSFLAGLLLLCRTFLHVLFDEFRRLAVLFSFLNPSQRQASGFLSLAQFFLGLREGFSQRLLFCPQTIDFFLLVHVLPCTRKVTSEHLR